MAEVNSTFNLQKGDLAPEFTLPDYTGEPISLDEATGESGLLVVFGCNHCPFVIHLADALAEFADEIFPEGIETVVINSNDIEKYPQDGPEQMEEFAAKHDWKFPYLLDETQEIAKAYGAACTPDFFLFDGTQRLFYAGQFDETRPKGGKKPTGADLREAVRRLLAGEPPPEKQYPSSGCSIKWK